MKELLIFIIEAFLFCTLTLALADLLRDWFIKATTQSPFIVEDGKTGRRNRHHHICSPSTMVNDYIAKKPVKNLTGFLLNNTSYLL